MHIDAIPAFDDNYFWLLSDPSSDAVGIVDPGDAAAVITALNAGGLRLTHIFVTHHHGDHVGGVEELKSRYGARVIGAAADSARIPGLDIGVKDGDTVDFGTLSARVLETPGHTSAHISYWFSAAAAVFCGDTLFALGCGRLFEGSPAQMWASLSKLRALPADTRVFCAHEYTASNARFAATVETDNPALAARITAIQRLRANGHPTVPSKLSEEIATNPFLRADIPAVQAAVGLAGGAPAAVFAEIRRRKDEFRG